MDILITSLPLQIAIVSFILLFIYLAFRKPRSSSLLIPILLPLYLIKIYFRPNGLFHFSSYFTPPYSETPVIRPDNFTQNGLVIPTNLLEILLIFYLLINFRLIIRSTKGIWKNSLGKYLLVSILILLCSVVISTIYAVNLRVALGAAKSWFFLPALLFFAILPYFKLPEFRSKILYSLVISGAFLTLTSSLFFFGNILTYDGRLTGIFLSPNHLAMGLIPGLLALILLISRSNLDSTFSFNKSSSFRHFFSLVSLLFFELAVLYKTYSYGGWLGVIAGSTVIIIFSKFRLLALNRKSIKVYAIAAFALILLFFTQTNNPKLQHILNGDYYSSLHSRLMIWQSALVISQDHWLTGIGADNFQQVYLDYAQHFKEPYIEWSAPQPHNIFLAFLTQLGVLGLLSFISILALSGYQIINLARSHINIVKDPLFIWASAYLFYLIIHGLIDTPYFKNDLAILFWLAIAAIWATKPTHTTNEQVSL